MLTSRMFFRKREEANGWASSRRAMGLNTLVLRGRFMGFWGYFVHY